MSPHGAAPTGVIWSSPRLEYFVFFIVKSRKPGSGCIDFGLVALPGMPRCKVIVLPVTSINPTWTFLASSPSVIVRSMVMGFAAVSIFMVPRSVTFPSTTWA
jgi:hypothetical protein